MVKLQHHKRLLPFTQRAEEDTINLFSLNGLGEMGAFVSVESGNLDERDGWNWDASPGATYDRIHSYRYETKMKVRPVTSGDTKAEVLGVALFNTQEVDENGEKYLYYPQKAKENHVVTSGKTLPVSSKGLFTISHLGFSNEVGVDDPEVNDLVVPSNTEDGKIALVSADEVGPRKVWDGTDFVANTEHGYFEDQVLGKVLGTGSLHGGYVLIKLDI